MALYIEKINYTKIVTTCRSFVTLSRLITTTAAALLLVAVFFFGAHRGYNLGYSHRENSANGWWIDKKSRYYESSEIKKKRINLKYKQI